MSQDASATRLFLNSYLPLVATKYGEAAAKAYGLPPFIDGSIRREPDLQNPFPSISCLCRAGKFAPRLQVGDVVAYMTLKRKYGEVAKPHRRLTAVLKVQAVFPSHADAAAWYCARHMPLPSNCMIDTNPPWSLEKSHMHHKDAKRLEGERLLRRWDAGYRLRASKFGAFVVCDALFNDTSWIAPVVEDEHLIDAFGMVPATRNPGTLPIDGLLKLKRLLGMSFRLSRR